MKLHALRERWNEFTASTRGRRTVRVVRAVLLVGVLAFFVYQFTRIGWADVWNALPEKPLFYALLLVSYVLFPVSDAVIYRRLWPVRGRAVLAAAFRKRALNQDLLTYSGEAYFYTWARRHVPGAPERIAATIKDNLLLLFVASVSLTALILAAFLATGQIAFLDQLQNRYLWYGAGGAVILLFAVSAVVTFREALLSIPERTAAFVGGVHATRLLIGRTLLVVQWVIVVPDAPFQAWASLLVVMLLTKRIPFVPSSDLLFVSLGAQAAVWLDVSAATVAGMLLVQSAVEKALNAGLWIGWAAWDRLLRKRGEGASATSQHAQEKSASDGAPAAHKGNPAVEEGGL